MDGLIKITPDKERAKSLLQLALLRKEKLSTFTDPESSLFIESSYEIIKELLTALLFIEGYKSINHVSLINFFKRENILKSDEIILIDTLRKLRNDLVYRGVFVDGLFVKRNTVRILSLINQLISTVKKKSSR